MRVLSATNRDLAEMVEDSAFRKDLYYRLNVIPLTVPPLRERIEDIPLLARHLMSRHAKNMGCAEKSISTEAVDALTRYSWPGNVREMSNVLERALGLSENDEIRLEDLPSHIQEFKPSFRPEPVTLGAEGIDLEKWLPSLKQIASGRPWSKPTTPSRAAKHWG